MKRIFTVILVCAAALCAMCSCGKKSTESSYVLTKANSYQETLENLIKSMNECDGAQYVSLQYPDVLVAIMRSDGKFENSVSSAEAFLSYAKENYTESIGSDITFTLNGDITESELTDEQSAAAREYFVSLASYLGYDLKELDIVEGYEISFTVTYTGSDGSFNSDEVWCTVNIANGGWKIIPYSAADLAELYSQTGQQEEQSED